MEEDGEWEAPLVRNPACERDNCGEWAAPLISNPDFKGKWRPPKVVNPGYNGEWAPRKIDNPHFFVDDEPYAMSPIGGVGIELWTLQNGILFDNILLCSDAATASRLAAKTFLPRKAAEDGPEVPPLSYMELLMRQKKKSKPQKLDRDEL